MQSYKTQLPVFVFLVIHQFLYQQISFLQCSRNSFNIIWKRFLSQIFLFVQIHPLPQPDPLNGQNLLNVTKVFLSIFLNSFWDIYFQKLLTKSCKAFFEGSNYRFSALLFRMYLKNSYFGTSISNYL